MKIERLKSILLIILVISSILLTANKWFDEELWPGGYSFFSNAKERLFGNTDKDGEEFNPNEEILRPAKIIVNNLNNHILYTKSQENYDILSKEITDILSSAFDSTSIQESSMEEWNSHLQAQSCYLIYPVIYDASYFASQLSKSYKGSIKYFKEFVIAKDARIPSTVYLYAKDAIEGKTEKIRLTHESSYIDDFIENAQYINEDINYYSFELNFNTADEDGKSEHAIINDNVLINISGKRANKIKEKNLFYNIALNEELYTSILSEFNFNTSTIRKYVEANDSMVFVENYGTLKLHSNGLLDYKATDKSKGIELDNTSVKSALNSCIGFVDRISSIMDMGNGIYYEISSDIHDIKTQSFTMSFDYYINDSQIIVPADRFSTKNSINIEVSNGRIVSYTQIFLGYDISDEMQNCGSAIDAVDRIDPHDKDETEDDETISDIFTAYSYDLASHEWHPSWHIKDSKGNYIPTREAESNELEEY